MPVSQSSARRHWPQNAQQGPPPMGQPQSPPEPLQRSRAASPSPVPACCRSPSADVSANLHGQPACPLASPACPQDPLPTPGSLPVPWHPLRVLRISCLPPGSLPVPGVLTCPWHPLPLPKFPACPRVSCLPSSWSWSLPSPLLAPRAPTLGAHPRCPQPVPGASRWVPSAATARRAPEQRLVAGGSLRPTGPD